MKSEKPLALILEDDEDLSVIFTEALNSAGFETESIRNGHLALKRLKDVTPELVILDLHLPEVSGPELMAYIRAEKRLELTNVVVTTADAIMAEQVRDSADFLLIKPISFSQMRDLAARLNPLSNEDF